MKISKSFKTYIHIILVFLLSQSLNAAEDFSKNIVIHEKPVKINELKFKDADLNDVDLTNKKGNIIILILLCLRVFYELLYFLSSLFHLIVVEQRKR